MSIADASSRRRKRRGMDDGEGDVTSTSLLTCEERKRKRCRNGSSEEDYACMSIKKPGGYEVMELQKKSKEIGEVGPNVRIMNIDDESLVCVDVLFCGVNYADVCVRWGLYSSANKFSQYPMTPGFEFCGRVRKIGKNVERDDLRVGSEVFGVTMFGGYSQRVSVPEHQIFLRPEQLSPECAAGFPAVSLTAYHAMYNLAAIGEGSKVLIHSASGGVGSTLVQLAKARKCSIVVGVVGAAHKVSLAKSLGCDFVIDKSKTGGDNSWWKTIDAVAPSGFDAVFDANGISTLSQSYARLSQGGRLIVYGFHSMLPKRGGRLGAWQWMKLAWQWLRSPTFDPLDMTPKNISVMAFNLSYMFDQRDLLKRSMDDLLELCAAGMLRVSRVTLYALSDAAKAHRDIESGQTIGKLVLDCSR